MDTLPWYRQPWPWFLIALPAVAVVGSIAAAVLAWRTGDEVVETDYYKRGLAINQELARRERAAQLGLTVEIAVDGLHAEDRVALRVAGRQPLPADATLQLRVLTSGHREAEHLLVLARTSASVDGLQAQFAGAWREDVAAPGSGALRQWTVESSSWRVDGDADWRATGGRASLTASAAAR